MPSGTPSLAQCILRCFESLVIPSNEGCVHIDASLQLNIRTIRYMNTSIVLGSVLVHDIGHLLTTSKQLECLSSQTQRTKVLRSTGLAERATAHGFRSSFKNWTLEQTDTPWAVSEAALAHILGNSTEQAYARSDLFERRRALMQQWADYLTG